MPLPNWLQTLAGVAPTIATALGGPFAGMAVSVIGKAIGMAEPSQDKIAEIVSAGNPETLLKLKQAEEDFQAHMKDLDIQEEQLLVKDTQDARGFWANYIKAGKVNIAGGALAILAVASVAGVSYLIFTATSINDFVKGAAMLILGRFLGYLDQIYNFEFGTTRTSRTQQETINNLSNGNGH